MFKKNSIPKAFTRSLLDDSIERIITCNVSPKAIDIK